MTKFALGLSAACAAVLGVVLWQQETTNDRLAHELAALHTVPTSPPKEPAGASSETPATPAPPVLTAQSVHEIEDELLVAAEFAVLLTPEQKERVRLDTIIRKGELDYEYPMLFRQLRLPPQTLDAFKTLLVERNQAIYDAKQLAKEEGLTPASIAEEKQIANSTVGDVDARIAALIGTDGLNQLHEYLDLSFFRGIASMARQNAGSLSDPADYDRVRDLARQLRKATPDYPELVYQNNGWPMNEPAVIRDTITAFLGDKSRLLAGELPASADIDRRMAELARDAILSGKLPVTDVSESVANEYKAELARRSATPKP